MQPERLYRYQGGICFVGLRITPSRRLYFIALHKQASECYVYVSAMLEGRAVQSGQIGRSSPFFLCFRTSLFQQPEWQDAHRLFFHMKSNVVEFLKGVVSMLDGYDEFSAVWGIAPYIR
jgi:hypothetical protein